MVQISLSDLHWLLLLASNSVRYSEQSKKWNEIAASYNNQTNAAINPPIKLLPDLHSVYQD